MKKLTTLFVLLFTAFNMLAANITLYFVDESGWGNIHAYAWKNSTQVNLGGWPGNPATLESETKGGKNVYSYTFESTAADRIIFNNGGNGEQTGDLTVNTSKPYYYSSTWNATITYDAATTTYCMAGTGVAGTNWCCGQTWSPSGCELTDGSISFSALPAGEYKFKITNGTWNSSWGYSALTSTTGCAEDADGNVVITLTQTSDVKIDFNSSTKKITVTITEVSTPIDPDEPVTLTATIAAIRSRLSINTNDFTDFAGLYVSKLPTVEGGTLSSYAWEYSTNNTTWSAYSDGDGASWDNIRPNKAGYYRCVLTYEVGGNTQTVNSNTLQITNKGGSSVSFSSNLPVVLVRTSKDFPTPPSGYPTTEQVAELKAKRSVDVKILWNKNGGNVSNSDINNKDMLHYDRKARMNYRGSSSLNNPKKSFAFVTGDKNCDSKKLGEVKTKKFAMFDGDSHKDWVMYASYPDATFMRNILSYHQYAKMTGLWGVKCRYVEMYLDGEYQGIYVFMDKMTQDETRINVNEDTGYIVRFDKTDMVDRYDGYSGANEDYKRCTFITSNTGKKTISTYNMQVDQAFEIEYPEREDIATFDDDGNVTDDSAWEAKVNEVKSMFVAMENAILANDYDKLAQIIDYESWADWFIFNEFSRNADAYRISCVFQINSASEKIVANPIWDYELGLGNQDTKTSGLMVEDQTYYDDDFPTPFWWTGKGKSGCNGILGDCKFKAIVKERWAKHIAENGALNSTVLNSKIDSLANVLSQGAGTREKSKWNTYSSSSTSTLKSWITNRTSALNSIINDWDACPDLKFALVGTINGNKISTYANGIKFTEQQDGSYTASFTATSTSHSLQIITSTGAIWARNDSKAIVSTHEDNSSYATMTSGQTGGYANITTVNNTEYTFTFKLNGDGESGKLTYLKGQSVGPEPEPEPEPDFAISAIRNRLSINTNDFTDFAGLYVAGLPIVEGGTLSSYAWQYSTDNATWSAYSDGQGASWDNIRPNKAGYYRCVITYNVGEETQEKISNTLQITNAGGSAVSFSSKLPVFLVRTAKDFPTAGYLDNDGVAALKAKRSVDVKILWNEEGGAVTNADVNNADMLHYDRKGRMNYRGSSSLRNDKKSYAFVTGDKNCDPKKLGEVKTKKFGMFGEAAQKDWVLYASAPDATYMRNVLSFHQYAQMTGLWGVKCRYVELYIDGSYKGIYVFMDKITQDENRVNVNEDTGFIVKFDKTDEVDSYDAYAGANEDYKRNTFLTSNTGRRHISTYDQYVDQAFEIEYPEREDLAEFDDDGNVVNDAPWEAKVAEVKGMFTAMENAILANDYDKLATIIDYESWADWFIMNEFSRNADAYRISCVFTINASGDKIVANPLWDYELGWGYQDTKTSGLMVEDNQYYNDDFPTPFWWTGKGKSNCNGILGDCKFRAIVKERWAKYIAADGALNSTVLNTKIDSLKTVLSGSSNNASVSTSSLKSWITNRTSGLNSVISAWETCPVPEISDLVAPEFTQIYVGEIANGTATFSVENASNVDIELSGDAAFSILSESNGVVEISFAPTDAGTFSGTLTITADGVVSETISFSASAILKPVISNLVAPEFAKIYVGETVNGTATFSVANASNVEVELSGDAAFSILSESNGVVEISFAPTDAGTFSGTLTITADAVVTETINFSASAILKPVISNLVAPEFSVIYSDEQATGTATYSVENANNVEVELTGDNAFAIASKSNGAVEITFTPDAAGTFNGTLTITADGVVSETISFSAYAILKPVISNLVAPEFSVIYSDEQATGIATYSVENANNVEVELTGDNAFAIASKSNGAVEITFTPDAAGTFNGTLTITADGVVSETISFSASAILKPVISNLVAPEFSVIYSDEQATATATYSIENANNVEVELTGDNAFAIASKSNGAVEITFTPDAAGTFSGTLTITADAVVTESINFSASAILKPVISNLVAPEFSVIYSDEQATGTATYSVENANSVEVELTGDNAFAIASKSNGAVEITFTPDAAGTFNGTLTITADGVVSETISFSAYAILKPVISNLSAPAFEQIYVGESAQGTATFNVENASNIEVELSGDAAFAIASETNSSVEITFTPDAAGTFNGTLTITADGVVTESIDFSASAILKPVISNLVAPEFTVIYSDEQATGTATYSVENANNVEVELTGDNAFAIASKSNDAVEITFTPDAAGTFNGTLTITADGVVTESIDFSASAILKPMISNLVAPEFTVIYSDEQATGTATYSVENATNIEVELTGDNAFAIASKSNGAVEITFTPDAAGTFNGILTITADGVVSETISFSAYAILKPVISNLVAPEFSVIYSDEQATGTATYSVENANNVEVELTGDNAFAIARKSNGAVEITFTPDAAGTFNATLTIAADGVVTESINFSASAILKPVISNLVAPIFEEIYVGETTTGTATFSVENANNVDVELSGDAAFSILSESDGSVDIVFIPTTEGTFSGTLTITADGVVTESINFSASAILKPVISNLVAPIFGELKVGGFAEATATYTIENATEAIVELIGDESFYIKEQSLGEVVIVFAPETVGEYSATLTIKVGEISESVEFTAVAIEDITTSVEENVALNIYAKDGTIYSDEEFTIYNLAGVDVTNLNGSLQGVYVVTTTNGNKQVSVW